MLSVMVVSWKHAPCTMHRARSALPSIGRYFGSNNMARPASSGVSNLGRLLCSPYYVLNICVALTYVLLRSEYEDEEVSVSTKLGKKLASTVGLSFNHNYVDFEWLEIRVAATLLLTMVFRSYRTTSIDAATASVLRYCQIFVLVMSFMVDKVIFAHYAIAFGMITLLVNEPSYSGPDKVETLTAAAFKEQVASPATAAPDVAYVAFLYAHWSASCRHAYPVMAALSNRFATDQLKFVKVDVGNWTRLGNDLGVDVSAASSNLPTFICFEGGEEKARVPTTSGSSSATLRKLEIINALELDVRYARSMQRGSTSATATRQAE